MLQTFNQPPLTSPQHFGDYRVRVTTVADIEEVLEVIKSRTSFISASKREAVYGRKREVIAPQVSNGFFIAIDRIASDEETRRLFDGKDHRIVAIVGAYPLGVDKDTNTQNRFPINSYNGVRPISCSTWEIGTSLYKKDRDLPNANGVFPKGCMYETLVGLGTLNLFRLAKQNAVEAVTANVQSHLGNVISNLTGENLRWSIVPSPSEELKAATSDTTADDTKVNGNGTDHNGNSIDRNFQTHLKQYYYVQTDKLATTAKFALSVLRTGKVTYMRGGIKNIVHINNGLPEDFNELIETMSRHSGFFRNKAEAGFSDVRRQFEPYIPMPIAGQRMSGISDMSLVAPEFSGGIATTPHVERRREFRHTPAQSMQQRRRYHHKTFDFAG